MGAHALRTLGGPQPLIAQTNAKGDPIALKRPSWRAARHVVSVEDTWRIDDEWWRERPIARIYMLLRLEDDLLITVYHDLFNDTWFEQRG